jgi:hypothetical protein
MLEEAKCEAVPAAELSGPVSPDDRSQTLSHSPHSVSSEFYTKKIRKEGMLDKSVSLRVLVAQTHKIPESNKKSKNRQSSPCSPNPRRPPFSTSLPNLAARLLLRSSSRDTKIFVLRHEENDNRK